MGDRRVDGWGRGSLVRLVLCADISGVEALPVRFRAVILRRCERRDMVSPLLCPGAALGKLPQWGGGLIPNEFGRPGLGEAGCGHNVFYEKDALCQ